MNVLMLTFESAKKNAFTHASTASRAGESRERGYDDEWVEGSRADG